MRRHVFALARCARRAFPVVWYANGRCRELTAAFEAAVAPLILTVANGDRARYLHDQLLSWGIKTAYMVENYARFVGSPPRPDLSILSGVFTRLYDDVLDELDDGTVAPRLDALFAGGGFAPRYDVEQLLEGVYLRLAELAPRDSHPTAYRALIELHRRQIESMQQADPALTAEQIWHLALAKGGWAVVVLCSLAHPRMSAAEEELTYELGAFLQVLDDYQDVPDDRRAGLRTTASDGNVKVTYLLCWLTDIEARMSSGQAESPCRAFFDSLYLWLYTVAAIRFARRGPVRRGAGPVPRRIPMRVILARRAVIR